MSVWNSPFFTDMATRNKSFGWDPNNFVGTHVYHAPPNPPPAKETATAPHHHHHHHHHNGCGCCGSYAKCEAEAKAKAKAKKEFDEAVKQEAAKIIKQKEAEEKKKREEAAKKAEIEKKAKEAGFCCVVHFLEWSKKPGLCKCYFSCHSHYHHCCH